MVRLRKRAFDNIVGLLGKDELNGAPWKLHSTFHFCFLGIRDRLPVHGLLLGLHRDRIGIDATNDVRRGDLAAIGHNRGRFNDPIVAVLAPGTFTESAVGLEFDERICLFTGSQPIDCVPRSSVPSFVSTVRVEMMKF